MRQRMLTLGALLTLSGSAPLPAADVQWQSVKTEHFVVHYPLHAGPVGDGTARVGGRLAQRAATLAEQSYARMTAQLQLSLDGPIHLVLEDGGEEASGLAEPRWSRITVGTHPGSAYPLRGERDWLQEAIAHELAHLMLVHAGSPVPPGRAATLELRAPDNGWWPRLTGAADGAGPEVDAAGRISLSDSAPYFWSEGGAEYVASLADANQWTSGRDMLMRMSFLEELILSPEELMSSLGKEGYDGERGYNQGYSFMLFMRERYGEESFLRVLKAAREQVRWNWVDAIEVGQGISYLDMYQKWKEWLAGQYQDASSRRGQEVIGEALTLSVPPWLSTDLDVRRRWMAQPRTVRQLERAGRSLEASYPTWSPDGSMLASWEDGLKLRVLPEGVWSAYGGKSLDPVEDRLELSRREQRQVFMSGVRAYPLAWSPDSRRLVAVAGERWGRGGPKPDQELNHLFIVNVVPGKEGAVTLKVADPGTPIPNTAGGQDPAWSPDGQWIAFVRYTDGTGNLWVVRPDGTDARALTRFTDGTSVGHPSWSPDSKQLVFHLFRRNQRDLWTIDPSTQRLQALMLDTADDRDAWWAADGKIYYTSDLSGVSNLYSYDPSTSEVRRLTDALGGVFWPTVTPGGNFTFSYFDGYSFKLYGLKAANALAEPVDSSNFFIDPSLAEAYLQGASEATAAEGEAYRLLKATPGPAVTPLLRVTERDVQAGGQLQWEDPLQRQTLQLNALAGLNTWTQLDYGLHGEANELELKASRLSSRQSSTLEIDTADGPVAVEHRREQVALLAELGVTRSLSPRLRLQLEGRSRQLGFRAPSDGWDAQPLYASAGGELGVGWSSFGGDAIHGLRGIDPRGGMALRLRVGRFSSQVIDPDTGGLLLESGDELGRYTYNRVEFFAAQALPLPWLSHTLEWRLNAGYVDQNVAWWDELKAGGRLGQLEPYLNPVVAFPGYDMGSLSGESLGVLALNYRVPIRPSVARQWGSLYVDSVYAQFGGTIGNVWGYRPSADGSVRERPLADVASRNSVGDASHTLLGELGAEVRVGASLFNRYRWGSFFRLGYALYDVTGVGDVNQDGVYPGEYGDLVPEAGGELDAAGIRVSFGLGTGF